MSFLLSYTIRLESELDTTLPTYEDVVLAIVHNQGVEIDKKNMQRDFTTFTIDLHKGIQKAKEEYKEYVKA